VSGSKLHHSPPPSLPSVLVHFPSSAFFPLLTSSFTVSCLTFFPCSSPPFPVFLPFPLPPPSSLLLLSPFLPQSSPAFPLSSSLSSLPTFSSSLPTLPPFCFPTLPHPSPLFHTIATPLSQLIQW